MAGVSPQSFAFVSDLTRDLSRQSYNQRGDSFSQKHNAQNTYATIVTTDCEI